MKIFLRNQILTETLRIRARVRKDIPKNRTASAKAVRLERRNSLAGGIGKKSMMIKKGHDCRRCAFWWCLG